MILTFKIGAKQTQVEHLGMGVLWARVSGEGESVVDPNTLYGWLEFTAQSNKLEFTAHDNRLHYTATEPE